MKHILRRIAHSILAYSETDHERDRLFQQHGIKVTQRFTAEECYSNAPSVVQRFLTLLDRNG